MNNKNLVVAIAVLWLSGCSAGAALSVTIVAVSAYQASDGSWKVRDDGGDPRRAPPMAPDRKVNEVDCSQPIDYSLGNIRCK
jgi:hypothetical protein